MTCLCIESLRSTLLRTSSLPDAHTWRKRPPPLPCEVSKRRTPGLAVLTWGGGVPKESVNPCPGTKRPNFELYYAYLPNVSPTPGECASAPSFGVAIRPSWVARLASTPALGVARTWRRSKRRPFLLAFPYDPACWPERWRMPRQRIDVRAASHFRSSSGSISRTCKETIRRRCGQSHSDAQVSDGITKY